jgi:hypothetical protein
MHVTGTDGTNQYFACTLSQRENQENWTSIGDADCHKALFAGGVRKVRANVDFPSEQPFDDANGNSMLLTFAAIAIVPIETDQLAVSEDNFRFVHTIVNPLRGLAPQAAQQLTAIDSGEGNGQ